MIRLARQDFDFFAEAWIGPLIQQHGLGDVLPVAVGWIERINRLYAVFEHRTAGQKLPQVFARLML